jgi:peptide-methionine (R)-S-oxide reductase
LKIAPPALTKDTMTNPSDRPTGPHSHDDPSYPVHKTDAEWRAQLDATQYQVARHAATERSFTGKYWDHWADGSYRCVGCGAVLFDSEAKFDAGCGWPSYSSAIVDGRVERVVDDSHGMHRVEVRCANCGSHLGHVFDDGPEPTGERFCINSAAIDFDPAK